MAFIYFLIFPFLIACNPGGSHKPLETKVTVSQSQPVSYEQVRRIFANRCSFCHPSRSGPDWLDYNQAKNYVENGKLLRRAVKERSMPPPGSAQAAAISDAERDLIGRWVEAGGPMQAEVAKPTPEPASTQVANAIPDAVQNCLDCHGAQANQAESRIPLIAGQNVDYLLTQLERFKWRARIHPNAEASLDLSETQMRDVAKYFSTREATLNEPKQPLSQNDQELFEFGKQLAEQRCVTCHMSPDNGNKPVSTSIPVLVGQSRSYLMNQLIFFRADDRLNPTMHEMARELSNHDIEGLSLYFSHAGQNLSKSPDVTNGK